MMQRTLVLLVPFVLAATAAAQKPTLEWQKRSTTIDYGSVPVGNHSLAELPIGQSWRLGANQQTVWRTLVPVIAGDRVLAPGNYVIMLNRVGEASCAIAVGSEFRVEGPLNKLDKPAKKLVIDLPKNGAAVNGNQPANFVVQFGEHEWKGAFTVPGNKTVSVGAWKLTVFSLPAAHIDGRGKTEAPIAALSKDDKEGWNLFVGDSEAKLVPWPQVGSGMPGAPAATPDPSLTTTGKVEASEIKVDAEKPVVELVSAKLTKGSLVVELASGKSGLRVTVPEPKGKAGK